MIREPFIMMIPGDFEVVVFYTAVCQECYNAKPLPIPFSEREERNRWVQQHVQGTKHTVAMASELRMS